MDNVDTAKHEQPLPQSSDELELLIEERTRELAKRLEEVEASRRELTREISRQKQIESELRSQLGRTEALYQVTRSLVATEGLNELLQTVVDSVAAALPADLIAILTLNIEAEELHDVVVGGALKDAWYPVSYESLVEGLPGEALRTMQPIISTAGVNRPYADVDGATVKDPGSVIATPLTYKKNTYGVMLAINWGTDKQFTSQDLDIIAVMAAQAAIAISHTRLFDETKRSLVQVQQIIQSVPSGVVLIDSEHEILAANEQAYETLSIIGAMDEGGRLLKLGDVPITEIVTSDLPETSDSWIVEVKGGSYRVAVRPVFNDLHEGQMVLVLSDISGEMAAMDHQLAQQRQAMVGQLAAGVAHDFNNILAVIILYCQLLSKATTREKHQQYIDTIHEQSTRGAVLVSQLLDFSRQSLMKPTSVDLVRFLRDIMDLLERTFPENISLKFTTEVENLYIHVDPTHLQQVFMNLAINSRDAMSEGGSFMIDLQTLDIGLNDRPPVPGMVPGIWAGVVIKDTGCGMPSNIQDRIFEPFFTTKARDQGTGLGLAQVYGIIQQLGGEITVSSQTDIGTQFHIYLPMDGLVSLPSAENPQMVELKSRAAEKTILLVEDEPAVRAALEDMLNSLGFEDLLVAENGYDALRCFRNAHGDVDLVFSDMVMPHMGGMELFDTLRDEQPDIKMIISTGYPLENGGEALLKRGIIDWVMKPFTIEEVSAKINRALAIE